MLRKVFLTLCLAVTIIFINFTSLIAAEQFYSETLQEVSPVQKTGGNSDAIAVMTKLLVPANCTRKVAFSGKPGSPAVHEGMDLVHDDAKVSTVSVAAAAPGVVAYVRSGCPQSAMFKRNTTLREAGAGWGNHAVIFHGDIIHPSTGVKYGFYTRYAHLVPGSVKIKPGDKIAAGAFVGEMGNSGRSEVRHLHFEAGLKKEPFITNKPAQSFDMVFDPARFFPKECRMDGYPSSGHGRASVLIKIYCGHDAQYSAELHSEGVLVSSYKDCNALVWAIIDAHMGYCGNLSDILKSSFLEALKKASIKDGLSASERSRVLVAPVVYVELRSVNSQGENYDDPLYRGELKFETVKYEE